MAHASGVAGQGWRGTRPQGGGHTRGRPQVNRHRQRGAWVARRTPWHWAHEQGTDAARLDEGAFKRARGGAR